MKLSIDSRVFNDPDNAVLLVALKTLKIDCVALLESGYGWVNCAMVGEDEFAFQYKDGETFQFFEPVNGNISFQELKSIFTGFLSGDDGWRASQQWQLGEFQLSPEKILDEIGFSAKPTIPETVAERGLTIKRLEPSFNHTTLLVDRPLSSQTVSILPTMATTNHGDRQPLAQSTVPITPPPKSADYIPRAGTVRSHGSLSEKMVCAHCNTSGMVHTKKTEKAMGVSGGKATGALLTVGLSLLLVGLSRKEKFTRAFCANCGAEWTF